MICGALSGHFDEQSRTEIASDDPHGRERWTVIPAMAGAAQQLIDEQLLQSEVAGELRRQRAALDRLAADIAAHIARLPGLDGTWRSPAQRAFSRRCDDLDEQLRAAWSALESAAAAVDHDLALLSAASSWNG